MARNDESDRKPDAKVPGGYRINPALTPSLLAYAERQVLSPTAVVNQAVREFLERHGWWAPELARLEKRAAEAGVTPSELLAMAVRSLLNEPKV